METITLIAALIAAGASVLAVAINRLPNKKLANSSQMFIDTSVLIDGRIIDIAKSGFIADKIVIPRSVIGELQLLADKGDTDKRNKARNGLDVITKLQNIDSVSVEIFADNPEAREGVDQRLITLASQYGGRICTVDFNLNKVAAVQGIVVCNVNELAKNLRMVYLPGETTNIHLTDTGQGDKQAVGHLDDGTMVVVEHASKRIGDTVKVEFIRGIQTDAGRMMFARLAGPQDQSANGHKEPSRSDKISGRARQVVKSAASRVKTPSKKPTEPKAKQPAPKQPADNNHAHKPANSNHKKPNQSNKKPRSAKSNEDRLVELANK